MRSAGTRDGSGNGRGRSAGESRVASARRVVPVVPAKPRRPQRGTRLGHREKREQLEQQDKLEHLAKRGPGEAGEAAEAGAAGTPLSESVKRDLIEQAQGKTTRQISELIAAVDPELVRARDRLRPLGGDRWELKAVIDGECQRGLEELRHLLSHVNPAMEYGELLQRLVADGLAKYDRARRPARVRRPKHGSAAPPADSLVEGDSESARTDGHRSELHPTPGTERGPHHAAPPAEMNRRRTWAPKSDDPQPAGSHRATRRRARATITRTIPAAVRRHIWLPDRGRCTYRDPESGRCCG